MVQGELLVQGSAAGMVRAWQPLEESPNVPPVPSGLEAFRRTADRQPRSAWPICGGVAKRLRPGRRLSEPGVRGRAHGLRGHPG